MKKPFLLTIIIVQITWYIILFIGFQPGNKLSRTEFAHYINYYHNMNSFSFDVDNNIDKNEIEIIWNKSLIYKGGKFINENIHEQYYKYGPNFFTIKYKSNVVLENRQYKFNNWHYFEYKIIAKKVDDSLTFEIKEIGP